MMLRPCSVVCTQLPPRAGSPVVSSVSRWPTAAQNRVVGQSTAARPRVAPGISERVQPDGGPPGAVVVTALRALSTPTQKDADGQLSPVSALVPPRPVATVAEAGGPTVTVARPGLGSGTRQLVVVGHAIPSTSLTAKPAGSTTADTVQLPMGVVGELVVAIAPLVSAATHALAPGHLRPSMVAWPPVASVPTDHELAPAAGGMRSPAAASRRRRPG